MGADDRAERRGQFDHSLRPNVLDELPQGREPLRRGRVGDPDLEIR